MSAGAPRRIRKFDKDLLWKLIELRALGFTEDEVAKRLAQGRLKVSQKAVSYQLRRLRERAISSDPDSVLFEVLLGSSIAQTALMSRLLLSRGTVEGT